MSKTIKIEDIDLDVISAAKKLKEGAIFYLRASKDEYFTVFDGDEHSMLLSIHTYITTLGEDNSIVVDVLQAAIDEYKELHHVPE